MSHLFYRSGLDEDINNWNVEKVDNMTMMFVGSQFLGDISSWKPYSLEKTFDFYDEDNVKKAVIPYWLDYSNKEERRIAIDNYIEKIA